MSGVAAALRVRVWIPSRAALAAAGCAAGASALLTSGSGVAHASAAPGSGGLGALKGQSEPPLVSGKPRTPTAANPFVTTVWAYASEEDRSASISTEKCEHASCQ